MVGSVYWFLSMATDLSGCRVQIFDLNKGVVVWDSMEHPDDDIVMEVDFSGFSDYEIESYDLYMDKSGMPCLDLNIDVEEEDEYE